MTHLQDPSGMLPHADGGSAWFARVRDAAVVVWPSSDEQWQLTTDWLTADAHEKAVEPLASILRTVRDNGCQTLVVELAYVDGDWRSEHKAFWATRHLERSVTTPRVHFFADMIPAAEVPLLDPASRYLGYAVIRPAPLGPVGRTLISVPASPQPFADALCTVTEEPSIFGTTFEVTGVPFAQQDGELMRCAHTAAWQVHYVAQGRGLVPRRLSADISSLPNRSFRRNVPSEGLTAEETQGALKELQLPALLYDVYDLPELPVKLPDDATTADEPYDVPKDVSGSRPHAEELRERLTRIICRYVSSGFPVIVFSASRRDHHAFTIVGWRYRDATQSSVDLIACDDQAGPYVVIADPLHDVEHRGVWYSLLIPLLEKVEMSGEGAERASFEHAKTSAEAVAAVAAGSELLSAEDLTELDHDLAAIWPTMTTLRSKKISVRTRLVRGRELKRLIAEQGRGDDVVARYRLASLPNWVWVVEFQDRERRKNNEACVLAEIVFDSTTHDQNPRPLLATTAGYSIDSVAYNDGDAAAEGVGPREPWWPMVRGPRTEACGQADAA